MSSKDHVVWSIAEQTHAATLTPTLPYTFLFTVAVFAVLVSPCLLNAYRPSAQSCCPVAVVAVAALHEPWRICTIIKVHV
eukprot:1160398-Pelagomonas_calceolata.AAC.5